MKIKRTGKEFTYPSSTEAMALIQLKEGKNSATEIARSINRTVPATIILLGRLIEKGYVEKRKRKYYLTPKGKKAGVILKKLFEIIEEV